MGMPISVSVILTYKRRFSTDLASLNVWPLNPYREFRLYTSYNIAYAFDFRSNPAHPGRRRSELVLGGVDPNHYTGDFTFTNLVDEDVWVFYTEGWVLMLDVC